MISSRIALRALLAIAFLIPNVSQAVDYTAAEEPGLNPNRDYVHQAFAEHIDPYNGNLQLHYVDGFAAGNAGFDLKIQRSYNALRANDQYSPFGRGWLIHFGRVRHYANQAVCNWSTSSTQSLVLELPDGSLQTFFKSNGVGGSLATIEYVTASLWKGKCDSASGGMIVNSPDGTSYEMTETDTEYWHVKRITDRNGNVADFTYTQIAAWGSKAVASITATGSRSASFSYISGRLSLITLQGRSWAYTVTNTTDGNQLTRVTPPAGGSWNYGYYGNLGSAAGSFALQTITYPQSGSVSYSYAYVNFNPGIVGANPNTAVTSKNASGLGSWGYAYTPSNSAGTYDSTVVTLPSPLGQITYKHFGLKTVAAGTVWKIGLLYQKTTGTLQTETYTWGSQVISAESQNRMGYLLSDAQVFRPLLSQRSISRNSGTFSTTYSNFDGFGNAQTVSESGPAGTRARTLTNL